MNGEGEEDGESIRLKYQINVGLYNKMTFSNNTGAHHEQSDTMHPYIFIYFSSLIVYPSVSLSACPSLPPLPALVCFYVCIAV